MAKKEPAGFFNLAKTQCVHKSKMCAVCHMKPKKGHKRAEASEKEGEELSTGNA